MIRQIITFLSYWAFNLLTGNLIHRYYKKVKSLNETKTNLANSSIENFLKNYGFNPSIETNPIQTKSDIKKRLKGLNQAKVKTWAYTGGSYGEPLRIPYSQKRNFIRTATFRYFNEKGGYILGAPFALIRAKNKSVLKKIFRNETIFIPYDTSENKIKFFVKELRSKKISVIIGYPTVIYDLALYLQKYPNERQGLRIHSIISVSEPLETTKRDIIKQVFNCSFIDRYSNEEVGLIAQQKEYGGPYYINKFGIYVEILDPLNLKPVKEGEEGIVVVTDLYNDLVPIVRYNTGDLAIAGEYKNGQLQYISKIQGRVSEKIFAANGNPVSSLILGPHIYKPLSRCGPVFQYQFAQTGEATYELRIKAKRSETPLALEQELKSGLRKILGESAKIQIKFKKNIKPLPSGKRPIYKNESNNFTI